MENNLNSIVLKHLERAPLWKTVYDELIRKGKLKKENESVLSYGDFLQSLITKTTVGDKDVCFFLSDGAVYVGGKYDPKEMVIELAAQNLRELKKVEEYEKIKESVQELITLEKVIYIMSILGKAVDESEKPNLYLKSDDIGILAVRYAGDLDGFVYDIAVPGRILKRVPDKKSFLGGVEGEVIRGNWRKSSAQKFIDGGANLLGEDMTLVFSGTEYKKDDMNNFFVSYSRLDKIWQKELENLLESAKDEYIIRNQNLKSFCF